MSLFNELRRFSETCSEAPEVASKTTVVCGTEVQTQAWNGKSLVFAKTSLVIILPTYQPPQFYWKVTKTNKMVIDCSKLCIVLVKVPIHGHRGVPFSSPPLWASLASRSMYC